jgi:acetyl esterase/lipase
MDIYVPDPLQRDPAPAVLNTGVRLDERTELLARGYIVAIVRWREPPRYKLPIGIVDTKCAVRFLRANAATFHIDPDHIAAWGCSRGGHMAAMVGLTDPNDGLEGQSGFADQSSRLQAVVVMDGIANFETNYTGYESELEGVHGISSFDDPLIARLSPVSYISPDDPSFLLIVSEEDNRPSEGQSISEMRQLHERLKAAGVSVEFVEVARASHCNFTISSQPSSQEIGEMIGDFFDQHLK